VLGNLKQLTVLRHHFQVDTYNTVQICAIEKHCDRKSKTARTIQNLTDDASVGPKNQSGPSSTGRMENPYRDSLPIDSQWMGGIIFADKNTDKSTATASFPCLQRRT
jgi:hypothetical protein